MTTVLRATLLTGIFLMAMAIAAPAQTVSTIYQFGTGANPNEPSGAMAQGRDGNFYGVTQSGNGCCQGIVYKISSGYRWQFLWYLPERRDQQLRNAVQGDARRCLDRTA